MTNAILMASGLGTRMHPLTLTTPKPLIKVNGVPMIETVIQGLIKNGVNNIYIVVGYLAEQFEYLTDKYKGLTLIKNPDYREVNNISSIYYAKEKLLEGDCYICEADLYLFDSSILNSKPTDSCYFGKMVQGLSQDWVFDLNEKGYISRVGKYGKDSYNMVGISYFKKEDAKTLSSCINETYGKTGFETLFWDDVVNNNLDKLKLKINPIKEGQIVEIDTVEELAIVEQTIKNPL